MRQLGLDLIQIDVVLTCFNYETKFICTQAGQGIRSPNQLLQAQGYLANYLIPCLKPNR